MRENTTTNFSDWGAEAGPLKSYLADPSISEIMVNRWDRIFIERGGIIEESTHKFQNAEALMRFVQSIAVICKRELNNKHPYLDTRLPDGSRLNAVIPPISLDGPSLTIRKFTQSALTYQQLIQTGAATDKLIYFLNQAVLAKQNILISGGTGSGKTTLLNILSSFIPSKERIVTIEDTAELQIAVKNIVRLETRPQLGGEEPITVYQLLKNALRMRPDRILVGECRGAEAWDMLLAMNTGHEGSMTTLHANSASDALRRLESMIARAGLETPRIMIREDIGSAIDLILHAERDFSGKRKITEVLEVFKDATNGYNVKPLFKLDLERGLVTTGIIPHFVSHPLSHQVKFKEHFFHPDFKLKLSA